MTKNIHLALALPLAFAALAVSAAPALAIQADDRTPAAIRQELRLAETVRIAGTLTCRMGDSNTGQPCAMRFEEPQSGRVFSFANPNEAYRMFNSGNRYVSIVGRMANDTTIEIQKIAAL